jgi:hypothetical protein
MKEKYLHYLWRYKLIPFHQLTLTDGRPFRILNSGEYNAYESGPDFLNAKIEIDSIIWSGNVELHVKSKDWYEHRHHTDRFYDTVVLHVVYDHNGEVVQNGHTIPTLELRSVIDPEHYKKYATLLRSKKTILCGSLLSGVPQIFQTEMIDKALLNRLDRKTSDLVELTGTNDPKQILYFLLARAMGAKINQLPFEELTHRLPISVLKKLRKEDQKSIVQITSGVFSPISFSDMVGYARVLKVQAELSYGMVTRKAWKFGGTRPGNAPDVRIEQFAEIIKRFDFETSFIYLSVPQLMAYIYQLLDLQPTQGLNNRSLKLTKPFKELLLINWIVPFMYWYGQTTEDESIVNNALEILTALPPEKNGILNKWNEFGRVVNNAADSQALLEIFNEFCTKKKCLSCSIGYCLLNK